MVSANPMLDRRVTFGPHLWYESIWVSCQPRFATTTNDIMSMNGFIKKRFPDLSLRSHIYYRKNKGVEPHPFQLSDCHCASASKGEMHEDRRFKKLRISQDVDDGTHTQQAMVTVDGKISRLHRKGPCEHPPG